MGTPERIRAKYRQAIEQGAPELFTEICRGTPRENVRAFVEVAREYEKRQAQCGPTEHEI
ncbi:MAG: hypothetical protein KAQ78_02965 [Candidatus Latescibacteria bacterium]|nr:hypothetical protein [Candidatus Latescibacterota bacterium]